MKRLISAFCLLAMLLSLIACSSEIETEPEETERTKTEEKNTATEKEKGEIVYPDSFAVGYARIDITGTLPIPIFEDEGTALADPLYLTCTAVWDGKQAVLLMSADLRGMQINAAQQSGEIIQKQFGIPPEKVIIN